MSLDESLSQLRMSINNNLRIQRDNGDVRYVSVGTALQDIGSKQNHVVFARRGCGKTLLLQQSAKMLPSDIRHVYLNCEEFKRHSFPNVLIEILKALFREVESHLGAWFGQKRELKKIIAEVIAKLEVIQKAADSQTEDVKSTTTAEEANKLGAKMGGPPGTGASAMLSDSRKAEVERTFRLHREKLQELDRWLPELKKQLRQFFTLSSNVKAIFLQIDDLYHLKRTDQAFVVDYIHRLCKDLPLYFKMATLRHASTLYVERDGQPIGAQERHDFQPINIDYTFSNFSKTEEQNWGILAQFGAMSGLSEKDIGALFKGQGFARLVMAGGGVPRDVLSLFLAVHGVTSDGKIGKDDVRILSKEVFEQRIEELKNDSQQNEQAEMMAGIYVIREFCLEKKTNIFLVSERMLQENAAWRSLLNRLMDYRIIHSCATALTHKSQTGTFQGFAIDIGCYAHLRKLEGRFTEIDVSNSDAKEKMRSAPILGEAALESLSKTVPQDVESALLTEEGAAA